MSRINLAPIVEGYGDNAAVRELLQRVWTELLGGEYAEILRPIRQSRGKLLREDGKDLVRAINLALNKLEQVGGGVVFLLIDAEEDCQKLGALGPLLLARAKAERADADIACAIANVMYETWFVAAAESLNEYLDCGQEIPQDPEAARCGKEWIRQHIRGRKYSETIDQVRLTHKMDLNLCRQRSHSFDKLCRELEKRMTPPTSPTLT